MDFFRLSAGQWNSQRTTHHLPFRRAELGGSVISVQALEATDSGVVDICQLHNVDPSLAVGGALVTWQGSMAWDKEDENHEGRTVFALVPDADNPQVGQLLRERGYAEIVPVIGRYEIDAEGGLLLTTEYETMSSVERFWFANPNLRLRTSVVKRFGGFSTASFCAESRLLNGSEATAVEASAPSLDPDLISSSAAFSAFGW
ncbi:phycobiliprotein lyase [Leptolyngbya sp. BL0902]|nr:phycobiliprotein lyase [Leptolyngbya sp. BL0902]